MKNSGIRIKTIKSSGNWTPLFENLPQYKEVGDGFTDGCSVFMPNKVFEIELQTSDKEVFSAIKKLPGLLGGHENVLIFKSPGGIVVGVYLVKDIEKSQSPFLLNHVAIAVTSIDEEAQWWKKLFLCKEVLRVTQGFDPIVNGPLNTLHMYKEGELYVTLREEKKTGMHHFGFELIDEVGIQTCKEILAKIGFDIFWEGMIDHSYVVHFFGPDGRIHDFFLPSASIRTTAHWV